MLFYHCIKIYQALNANVASITKRFLQRMTLNDNYAHSFFINNFNKKKENVYFWPHLTKTLIKCI